jgi:cytosine/adenosine deaminase-related metal-dependent hydrolase
MVPLHLRGLVAALQAIADDGYRAVDSSIYDCLPRANELKLYDVAITGGHLLDAECIAPVRADLGVNHSHGQRLSTTGRPEGKIVDIGDLGTATGKVVIDAVGCLVLPGRMAFLSDWTPGATLDAERIDALLSSGVTTVVGCGDTADRDSVEAMALPLELPINWCFAPRSDTEKPWPAAGTYRELAAETLQAYGRVGLAANRGKIRRECFADLILFDSDGSDPLDWRRLKRVVVAGETVWADGKRTGGNPGALLRPAEE